VEVGQRARDERQRTRAQEKKMPSKMHRSGRREEKSGGRKPALFESVEKVRELSLL
jgi:hypothetical protein